MPEPLVCLVTCKLPPDHTAANLSRVVLQDADRLEIASIRVERIQTLEKKKGVGMCVGPVFSDVPHFMVRLAFLWLLHVSDCKSCPYSKAGKIQLQIKCTRKSCQYRSCWTRRITFNTQTDLHIVLWCSSAPPATLPPTTLHITEHAVYARGA